MQMARVAEDLGDDGRTRTGTVWTATAHAVTAIIGSGVLALPWSVAQLGWILGPIVLIFFAFVTYYTATLLSDCYRSPGPVDGRRNYTYMDAVRAFLGERDVLICGIAQNVLLWGTMVGYTITAAMSMMAIKLSNCFHSRGRNATGCDVSGNLFMIIFGAMEIILSQLPNLEKITILSYVAAAMSFAYSFIGLYLCVAVLISHHQLRGSLFGAKVGVLEGISLSTKLWHSFQALGNIAFAYTYAMVLIEIQDTLRSAPPENKTMKKASIYGIGATTLFYISLGAAGYAALGEHAPGNVLTGFYEPFWLIDIANLAVVVHLVGAYQVFAQPFFAFYENWLARKWPDSPFFHRVYALRMPAPLGNSRGLGTFKFTPCKLVLRTALVALTTAVAMVLPFFNAIMGLLGSMAFWPLTVYLPLAMHSAQQAEDVKRGHRKWVALRAVSLICLLVSLVAAVGSVADIVRRLRHAKLFQIEL